METIKLKKGIWKNFKNGRKQTKIQQKISLPFAHSIEVFFITTNAIKTLLITLVVQNLHWTLSDSRTMVKLGGEERGMCL